MKNCALILFFLLPAIFVYNQINWEQLNGPYGGEVNHLSGDPDNYLFAVVQQNILFRSDNYGQNWESVPNTPTELSSSKIFMGFDHKLYALEASTLYVSEDNGDSWQEVAQQAGLFSANVLPSGTIVGSTNGYILHSEDNGMTWDSIGIQTVVGGNEFRYDTISNRVFTFYTYQGKIHQSFDDGLPWSVLFDQGGERIYDIAVDIAGNLWVLGDNLIWFSSDNGANWASSSVLETGTSDINYGQIVALPNGRVWVRQGNTAFFTDDYGQTWDQNRFSFSDICALHSIRRSN